MSDKPDPSAPSGEYLRLSQTWAKVQDILDGADAIRAKGETYLPKHAGEEDAEYKRRLSCAPWQPEFEDILRTLAAKPFGEEVSLDGDGAEEIKALAEDIDRRGNNLTTFARSVFKGGCAKGWHYILVDYPKAEGVRTKADERSAGVRPYWVSLTAGDVLAYYTRTVAGREVCYHARIRANEVELDGFTEVLRERVKVFTPGRWDLWEKVKTDVGEEWRVVDFGPMAPLTSVPIVRFRTFDDGERPPLANIADKQIELYRALARKDEIDTKTAYPMLTANGLAPPPADGAPIKVGPGRILFAPAVPGMGAAPSWDYIQPDAAGLTELREGVSALVDTIRRLGMQPLTQRSGGVTATASAIEGAKAHSAVQTWALALKDALEQAFVLTAEWLGMGAEAAPSVTVDTDFSVEPYADAPLTALRAARDKRDLSQPTYWKVLRRFDVLPPDFDPDAEKEAIAEEFGDLVGEGDVPTNPVTGQPVDPAAVMDPRRAA